MNRTNDIIKMAREVGFVAYGEDAGEYRIPTPAFHCRLERFAALVAAAERNACAAIARKWDVDHPGSNYGGCIATLIQSRGQA
jgi:hypothetical protein